METPDALVWTFETGDSPTTGSQRQFGELRLQRVGRTAWLWYADFPPLSFPFGDITPLFDESAAALADTRQLVASPPTAYILVGEGTLGLDDVTAGDYTATWLDLATTSVATTTVSLDGGTEHFAAPRSGVLVLVLQRVGL